MKTKFLLVLMWTVWFAVAPVWVSALPSGGNITAGNGSIQTSGGNMTIQQNTQRIITNWQSFSIGAAESVTFQQPNSSSTALNRVIGTDPSLIMGRLSSNGRVFLSNPSGVLFGAGAIVNVHGLIATTLSISDQDFLNDNYRFFQDPTRTLASVINDGRITAGGFVGLFGPAVENRGVIMANLGSVVMASGEAGTLDFVGDNLIRFAVSQAVSGEVKDTEGNVLSDRVRNAGTIQADGGMVAISAWDAGQVVNNVINNEGIVQARSVEMKNGEVILHGGPSGKVMNTGTIDVTGDDEGETGGTAILLGKFVGVDGDGTVDASGNAGGGGVLIGGIIQNENPDVQIAQSTFIGDDASVKADATETGDGGGIIISSEGETRVYGIISAKGGQQDGNGGAVQTAGLQYLELGQRPDLTAANGNGGSWLIGPANIDLVEGGGASNNSSGPNFQSTRQTSSIGVDLITGALNDGVDVTVLSHKEEPGQELASSNVSSAITPPKALNVDADIDYNGANNGALHLVANNDININADIFDSASGDGDLLNLTMTADSDTNGVGNVNIASGTIVNVGDGDLGIIADDVDIQGQLHSTNRVYVTPRDNGTIGVDGDVGTGDVSNICDGPCGLTLSGTELQNVHAPSGQSMVIGNGFNDDVYVSGLQAPHTSNQAITDFRSAGDLRFVNAPSVFSSTLRALPFGGIYVNTAVAGNNINFSSIGNVVVNADVTALNDFYSFLPAGFFDLRDGNTITAANDIFLSANDINLSGNLVAGDTVHINNSKESKTIGLGNATGDLSIDNDELANISANELRVGDSSLDTPEVTVDGADAEHIQNVAIQSVAPDGFKGQITFVGSSKFNNLTLNAGDKILVDGNISTLGNLLASVEQEFLLGGQTFPFTLDGVGTFEVTADSNITSGGSITIFANELILDGNLEGSPVTCNGSTSCVVPLEVETPAEVAAAQKNNPFVKQGTQSTFLNYFIEDSQTNC